MADNVCSVVCCVCMFGSKAAADANADDVDRLMAVLCS